MSEHAAKIEWSLRSDSFAYEAYNREHTYVFDSGIQVPGSAAPEYRGNPAFVDPEELFLASIASCHMLTFLAIAAKKRKTVIRYTDKATGVLEPNANGHLHFNTVYLHPNVVFYSRDDTPTPDELEKMHKLAHEACFIANSIACNVVVATQRMFSREVNRKLPLGEL